MVIREKCGECRCSTEMQMQRCEAVTEMNRWVMESTALSGGGGGAAQVVKWRSGGDGVV